MSWWISRSNKGKGRDLWLIDVNFPLVVLILGMLLAVLLTAVSVLRATARASPEGYAIAAVGLLALGLLCLVSAKVSLFRRGFGSRGDDG